jgi:hypothetical protein
MESLSFENVVRIVNAVRAVESQGPLEGVLGEAQRGLSEVSETFERVLRETENNLNELSRIISELKVLSGSNK